MVEGRIRRMNVTELCKQSITVDAVLGLGPLFVELRDDGHDMIN